MFVVYRVVDEGFALADIESAPSAEGGLLGLRVFAPAAGVRVAGKGVGVADLVAEGAVEVDGLRVVAADTDGGAGARLAPDLSVMMLTTPPVALSPYSTVPAPRMISMRCTLSSGIADQLTLPMSIGLRR